MEVYDSSVETTVLPEHIANLPFEELLMKDKSDLKSCRELISSKKEWQLNREFHRKNKNRPREMSSKIRPSFQKTKTQQLVVQKKPIDPRFSSSYGDFDPIEFERNYKFIDQIKKKERKLLRRQLENVDIDENERVRIRLQLQRMENQKKEKIRQKKKDEIIHIDKQYQIQELREGRKPQYHKKSERKLFDLVHQFEELKEKGGLLKHIKRRRKKLTKKDRKNMGFFNSKKVA